MYFININITKHVLLSELENEKANVMLLFLHGELVFIELNFTVAVAKLGMTDLPVRWGNVGF